LQGVAEDKPVCPRAFVLIGVQLFGDIELGVAEQIKIGADRLMRLQRFENGLRGMPYMHEQRQGGD